jgi:hypothetical protein
MSKIKKFPLKMSCSFAHSLQKHRVLEKFEDVRQRQKEVRDELNEIEQEYQDIHCLVEGCFPVEMEHIDKTEIINEINIALQWIVEGDWVWWKNKNRHFVKKQVMKYNPPPLMIEFDEPDYDDESNDDDDDSGRIVVQGEPITYCSSLRHFKLRFIDFLPSSITVRGRAVTGKHLIELYQSLDDPLLACRVREHGLIKDRITRTLEPWIPTDVLRYILMDYLDQHVMPCTFH